MGFTKVGKAEGKKKSSGTAVDAQTLLLLPEWSMQIGYVLSLAFVTGAWIGLNQGRTGVKVNVKWKDLASSEYYATPEELGAFVEEFIDAVEENEPELMKAWRKAKLPFWFDKGA